MIIDNNFTNGVRFEGADGWIFVSRGGAKATASDPASAYGKALEASDPKILNSKIGPNEIHLLQEQRPPPRLAHQHPDPPAGGHHPRRSAPLHQRLHPRLDRHEAGPQAPWDPVKEVFIGDDEANAMRSRPQRAPYGIDRLLKKT